jgi:pyruvate/2-oxoglutarate dehydrogenase complex dihydrolipoamide acyltransferase (E2) component
MATSAQTLSLIIKELIIAKPATEALAIELLMAKGIKLPKALTEVKAVKTVSIFASKAAEDFADANDISIPEGFKGTAAKDKISVGDLKKMKDPPKEKKNISPSAEKFARDNGINIDGLVGSGQDGKVMLKDVKALKPEEPTKTEEPKKTEEAGPSGVSKLSPAVAKALKVHGIDEGDLDEIEGSGAGGQIMLKDIKDLIELYKAESDDKALFGDDE